MAGTTVMVTGATGRQGGALARVLLRRGHRVVALTRSPRSAQARELQALGAKLATGDFEDKESLVRAAQGVDALYAMTTPFEAGPDEEVRQGMHLADAARQAGVRHFVYTSVAGAERPTGVPHFDSKHAVERYVAQLRLPATVLGPAFFMENFQGAAFMEGLAGGVLALGLPAHCGLQMVALEDLAEFTARVLEWPEDFLGRRLDVASDEVTGEQAAALLTFASGHRVRYEEIPLERIRARSEDLGRMYEWLAREGYHADITTLRHSYPDVGWHTFEEWVRTQDWSALGPINWPLVETPAGAGT